MATPTIIPKYARETIGGTPVASSGCMPSLESGDHLTREEFERRYEAMAELKKAELINGVVYMSSAVRYRAHGQQHADLITWLGIYRFQTPGVEVGDNATLRLDELNDLQPDALLIIDPARGGQATISDDGYVESAPELVAEVASSSVSIDLHDKFDVYRRHKVREYIVWRVLDSAIDWFVVRGEQYEPLGLDADGVIKSVTFPGLWLDPAAMTKGDVARVFQVLQNGLASPEHSEFCSRLSSHQD